MAASFVQVETCDRRVHTTSRATRIQRGKSRQGCRRCKIRHLKCDETKPRCGNCSRSKIVCPGYEHVLRWSGKHEHFRAGATVNSGSNASTAAHHQDYIPSDVRADIRAIDWQEKVQPELFSVGVEHVWQKGGARTHADASSTDIASTSGRETNHVASRGGSKSTDRGDEVADSSDPIGIRVDQPDPLPLDAISFNPLKFHNMPRCTLLPYLVDTSTMLIDYWFTHVCQMWSTFDSDVNYNRQVAAVNCTTSDVVFNALQSMSAACLLEITPNLEDSFSFIISQAFTVVERRILTLHDRLDAEAGDIDIDLVFAVFALGTSSHWTKHFRGRDSLLNSARILLRRWQLNCGDLQPEIYAYFRQALVYWEMLLSITNTEYHDDELSRRRKIHQQRFYILTGKANSDLHDTACRLPAFDAIEVFRGSRPNSWCGISSEVIGIFGQAIRLYLDACERRRSGRPPVSVTTCDTFCDLWTARELQSELLAMDFNTTIETDEIHGFSLHTGDSNTPLVHHVYIAEAYRLASLLQLYLAYPDLEIQPWKEPQTFAAKFGSANSNMIATQSLRTEKLLYLSFQLVRMLEQISPRSGSRRMQPMLYISAAACLRHHLGLALINPSDVGLLAAADANENSEKINLGSINAWTSCNRSPNPVPTTPPASREVSKMRAAILRQLILLQHTLPSRPLGIAIDLVKAIWAAYDSDVSGTSDIHWPDIMISTGLQTMFG